jgi:hypothetical protein
VILKLDKLGKFVHTLNKCVIKMIKVSTGMDQYWQRSLKYWTCNRGIYMWWNTIKKTKTKYGWC